MREIKFEAYDQEEKRMIPFEELIRRNSIHDFLDDYINPFDEMVGEEKTPRIYRQYTGLLDSDGTEIYEGDVVKATDDRFFGSEEIVGQVYWNYGCWEVRQYIFKNLNNLEVIGNIYDNPELLEGGF